jgi:1,4-alpha-glucan branching enzyme
MPGDSWQKFANLRLLFSYMICQPGKKLIFMGSELGQWDEWWCKQEIHWHLLQYPAHKGIQNLVKDINHFYLDHRALWERDFDYTGFEWIDFSDNKNCIISYVRKSEHTFLLCMHNFTPELHPWYFVKIRNVKAIQEIFNTDAEKYGGSAKHNGFIEIVKDQNGYPIGVNLMIAPLATQIFNIEYQ